MTNKTEPLLSCLPSHDFFLIVERKTNTNFGPRLTLTITLDQIESKYFLNSTVFKKFHFFLFKIQISRNERQSVKFIFSNSLKVGSFFLLSQQKLQVISNAFNWYPCKDSATICNIKLFYNFLRWFFIFVLRSWN